MIMNEDLKNYSMRELSDKVTKLEKRNRVINKWITCSLCLLAALMGIVICLVIIGFYEGYIY